MHSHTTARRRRILQFGAPAAVLGVLAGPVVAEAAGAEIAPSSQPLSEALGAVIDAVMSSIPQNYTVQPGDTVSAIASQFKLRTADVLAANGLTWRSVIYPGQRLILAAPAPLAAPETAPASASSSAVVHTVAARDTIFAIAQSNGTTVDAVLSANGFTRSSIIYPGQTITVHPAVVAGGAQKTAVLNDKQAENARLIIRIGRELGVSDRGIAIALSTSMVESWLRNLDWGDRDSLGLFQQRPSMGWGSEEQIRDRGRSIRVFFGGSNDPNGQTTRGLLDIAGWESLDFSAAAQAVQVSAYPDRYGQWEQQAYQWISLHG